MSKKHPDLDTRTYSYIKLKPLGRALGAFEISQRRPAPGKPAVSYVRCRGRNGSTNQGPEGESGGDDALLKASLTSPANW
ncbi:hypothetical protein [Nocardia sp. NPDC059239]|uniref:hypothetical protein n=1 Tax=Nocardia sp. NPDC059239 TaxID=3346785 RepID=UPI0036946F1F